MTAPADPLEAAVLAGAIRALRNRAAMVRARASDGVAFLDGYRPSVIIIESKAAHLYRIARDLDRVASELEAGGAP
jgi:hypothetical protein